jgi:hypothetical protein
VAGLYGESLSFGNRSCKISAQIVGLEIYYSEVIFPINMLQPKQNDCTGLAEREFWNRPQVLILGV